MMKISTKQANKSSIKNIGKLVIFTIIEGTTQSGKKVLSALTKKRLSIEDFKDLMSDITLAGGYGFTKFYPEHKTKLISATGLTPELFTDLLNQYNWTDPTPKQKSAKSEAKAAKIKAKHDLTNEGIDLALLDKFKAFLASEGNQ